MSATKEQVKAFGIQLQIDTERLFQEKVVASEWREKVKVIMVADVRENRLIAFGGSGSTPVSMYEKEMLEALRTGKNLPNGFFQPSDDEIDYMETFSIAYVAANFAFSAMEKFVLELLGPNQENKVEIGFLGLKNTDLIPGPTIMHLDHEWNLPTTFKSRHEFGGYGIHPTTGLHMTPGPADPLQDWISKWGISNLLGLGLLKPDETTGYMVLTESGREKYADPSAYIRLETDVRPYMPKPPEILEKGPVYDNWQQKEECSLCHSKLIVKPENLSIRRAPAGNCRNEPDDLICKCPVCDHEIYVSGAPAGVFRRVEQLMRQTGIGNTDE